ncbi:RsmB/NOP family class I SAM-dependent RNA methyltransferase [Pontibaca methylaminivorans]|uniref:16S rRNA (Cytosine967-C5)-methyltransferase n=1 Tax=Pontibaca methylaminivorans TaxID=515897 RepID=A0A1R3WXV5_9RHOB|nr:RsmB/NOP family class I SAM-dependent RNA methyltransferase [Pontibaca methylaminivorans]SIT83371.1 16S rRNA (cytosine967-C5)-methyltransferase [Pontibaca methylaminivorans]
MTEGGKSARRAALDLLGQVLGERRLLGDVLGSGALDALPPPERARAQRLAVETLRGLDRADHLLAAHLRRPPPLRVRNALRLGTVELAGGAAAHGVVNAYVGIIGTDRAHARLKGLVNAVLRRVAGTASAAWAGLPVPRMAGWLRDPLVAAWGAPAVAAMERAHLAGAPLDITLKPGAASDDLMAQGAHLLPNGSLRIGTAGQVSALPGYESGAWWVQDAAASMPVRVLDPRAGESVLDLCAAPGGKTLQLAAAGAEVTAVDISEARLGRLRANLARTGLRADIRANDALAESGAYDAVLLDAPCSATGTLRRHPDLPHVRDADAIAPLVALQERLIDHAWTLVRPGGRLVFCTCSLLSAEGEAQLERALATLPGAAADRAALMRPGVEPGWITPPGGLRLRPDYWPDIGGMDGFFIARLNRAT